MCSFPGQPCRIAAGIEADPPAAFPNLPFLVLSPGGILCFSADRHFNFILLSLVVHNARSNIRDRLGLQLLWHLLKTPGEDRAAVEVAQAEVLWHRATGNWAMISSWDPSGCRCSKLLQQFKKKGFGKGVHLSKVFSKWWVEFCRSMARPDCARTGKSSCKTEICEGLSPGASSCLQHTAGNSQELVKMLNIHLSELCQAGIVSELCQAGIFSELCQAGIFSELCQAFQGCSPPLHYELFSVHWISSYHISISAAKNTSLISDVLPWANCTEIRIFLQHHMP